MSSAKQIWTQAEKGRESLEKQLEKDRACPVCGNEGRVYDMFNGVWHCPGCEPGWFADEQWQLSDE